MKYQLVALGLISTLLLPATGAGAAPDPNTFRQTDLVSELPGRAAQLDFHVANPWGIVVGANGQFRVSDGGRGVSTAYSPAGLPMGPMVTIPPAGTGRPTGLVVNPSPTAFTVTRDGRTARTRYIYASEDGTLSAWCPTLNPDSAITVVTVPGAIFKGLAIGRGGSGLLLYVADFHSGTIAVFDRRFNPVHWPGAFVDPTLPAGYAPYNVSIMRGRVYVAYAKQDDAAEDDVAGAGFGYVGIFSMNGKFQKRLISGGALNAPWAMVMAPQNFGGFGHALLVGNFGDGTINAFDAGSGNYLGTLQDEQAAPIVIEGLWGLAFRNAEGEGDDDDDDPDRDPALYFTAGIEDEEHGLIGTLNPVRSRPMNSAALVAPTTDAAAPLRVTSLSGNPSRLSSAAGIQFQVSAPGSARVDFRIYDAAGRLMAQPLPEEPIGPGAFIHWDGRNQSGVRVPAGVYFYRAIAGDQVTGGRLILLP